MVITHYDILRLVIFLVFRLQCHGDWAIVYQLLLLNIILTALILRQRCVIALILVSLIFCCLIYHPSFKLAS